VEPILIKRIRSYREITQHNRLWVYLRRKKKTFYKNGTKKGENVKGGIVLNGGKM
jgi:hypothetical protein